MEIRLADKLLKNSRKVEIFYCRRMAHDPIMSYTKDLKAALPEYNIYNDSVMKEMEKWIRRRRQADMRNFQKCKRLTKTLEKAPKLLLKKNTMRKKSQMPEAVKPRPKSAERLGRPMDSKSTAYLKAEIRFWSPQLTSKRRQKKMAYRWNVEMFTKLV
jgi:hypothetical protein